MSSPQLTSFVQLFPPHVSVNLRIYFGSFELTYTRHAHFMHLYIFAFPSTTKIGYGNNRHNSRHNWVLVTLVHALRSNYKWVGTFLWAPLWSLLPATASKLLALSTPFLIMRATLCLHFCTDAGVEYLLQVTSFDAIPLYSILCHPLDWLFSKFWINFRLTFLAILWITVANFLLLKVNAAPSMSRWPAVVFLWAAEPCKTFCLKIALALWCIFLWCCDRVFSRYLLFSDSLFIHGCFDYTLHNIRRNFRLIGVSFRSVWL